MRKLTKVDYKEALNSGLKIKSTKNGHYLMDKEGAR